MPVTVRNTDILFNDGTTQGSAGGPGGGGGQAFTSSGTFTVPAGITKVKVTVVGGGGGTLSTDGYNALVTAGAGGGGAAVRWITGLTPGQQIAVTVGAAGGQGAAGGTSSFGAFCSATGGPGGTRFSRGSPPVPPAGGVGSGGNINLTGQSATRVSGGRATGGSSPLGLGFGGIGDDRNEEFNHAVSGIGFGAGASGSFTTGGSGTNGNGASGTAGVVIVEW